MAILLEASSLLGIAKSTLPGSQLVSTMPKVLTPRRRASAKAMCSCPISTMNKAAGTRLICAIPPNTFSSLSLSLDKVRRSFLFSTSVVAESPSILSMFCIFFTLLRMVLKLVSMPPSHLSVTKGMFTFFALSMTSSLACFFVATNMIFFPLRAIAFMAAAAS